MQTEPPGALVLLGDHANKSPATFTDLEARKYNVRIMSPGYDPVETVLDLSEGKAAHPPLFQLVRSRGSLDIESQPPDAQYVLRSEDGKVSRTGTLPAKISDLPTGKYSLVAKRGDWEMPESIEIRRGETARKSFAFVFVPVSITSEPPGADILVDGNASGHTPCRLDLPARPHELVAHLDGWPDEERSSPETDRRKCGAILCSPTAASKSRARPAARLWWRTEASLVKRRS